LSALGFVLTLHGCIDDGDRADDPHSRGDLGVGDFMYECFNETDITCIDNDDDLPRAIAVGGRFDLRFTLQSGPQPTVTAPAMDFVRAIEGGFQVRAPGEFALLALNGNREVVDIKHLLGMEIEEIRVQEEDSQLPSDTLRLTPRQSLRLLAVPYGSRGVKLGGALSYAWSSSDDTLVSIETLNALNRVRVRAGSKAGKGTLQIDLGGKTYSVNVEVAPAETALDAGSLSDASADARSDASETERDASSDADTDGGTP
jgi:hypothetical protein